MAPDHDDDLRDRLRRALPAAMKARDAPAVAALRSALAAIDNAEAVDSPGAVGKAEAPDAAGQPEGAEPGTVTDAQAGLGSETRAEPGSDAPAFAGTVLGVGAAEAERRRLTAPQTAEIVRAEIAERESAADAYDRAGQAERAERLRDEARVLRTHLEGPGPKGLGLERPGP
jgi:uncharacterized protein